MQRLMTDLPARNINRWQVRGGDLCVLPVGSVERLGPHLPLGGRSFAALAFARLMAEAADGLYLPVVPFTPAFESAGQPGTIDVADSPTHRLLRAAMDDLYETGFRRIVLVTWLEYARYYLPTEFYEDKQCGALGVMPLDAMHGVIRETGIREDSVILGALRVLGRDDLLARCMDAAKRWRKSKKAAPAIPDHVAGIQKFGMPAFKLPQGSYRLLPDDTLDPEAGESAMRRAIEQHLPSLDALREYNAYLSRRGSRGFDRTPWFREVES